MTIRVNAMNVRIMELEDAEIALLTKTVIRNAQLTVTAVQNLVLNVPFAEMDSCCFMITPNVLMPAQMALIKPQLKELRCASNVHQPVLHVLWMNQISCNVILALLIIINSHVETKQSVLRLVKEDTKTLRIWFV